MKVLMLGWELPPYNSGGLGTACYHMCRSLAKKGVDIEFILPYSAEFGIDFMKVTPATLQPVNQALLAGFAYDSQKYVFNDGTERWLSVHDQQHIYETAVAQLAEEREFDVVHAHDWLTFRAAIRVKEARNCPVILHVHSVESDRAGGQPGNPLVEEIENISMHLADRVIAVSQHTKNCIIRDYNIPADKIEVVHNSIEVTEVEPLDSDNAYKFLSHMKNLGYRVVVNVGRLEVQKGLTNLLLAAKEVIERVPKTFFLIVGSGTQYRELIEMAAALDIGENVIFADFQRGKNWRDAFGIADLFVMPSVSEPFGLTGLEAISYGSPILITKQSGVGEVINNCLRVDFWDINEMANKIAAVMQSDELRDELWHNSYDEYQSMTWGHASDRIINLYHDVPNGTAKAAA